MRFPLVLDMNKYVDHPAQAEGDAGAGAGTGVSGAPGGIVRERSDFQARAEFLYRGSGACVHA